MDYLFSIKRKNYMGSLLVILAILFGTAQAANTAQIEIKATVVAVCSVDAPAVLDMGTIPLSAFAGKEPREEVDEYAKTFKIDTTCSGTSRYSLAFSPSNNTYHLLYSDKGLMGFAFYDPDDKRMDFSTPVSLTRSGNEESLTIKVVPAKTSESVGADTASVTITISPL